MNVVTPENRGNEMTTFLLIRHASCDALNRLIPGRMPGVHLNPRGERESRQLSKRLSHLKISAIFCSPLERAVETAGPLAKEVGLPVTVSTGLDEIHFGDWTGFSFEELSGIPRWRRFNYFRSGTDIPGGEMIIDVQKRVIAELNRLQAEYPDDIVALISHGDVIKAAVLYYGGIPLDFMQRIEISPASVSIIALEGSGPRIVQLNNTGKVEL